MSRAAAVRAYDAFGVPTQNTDPAQTGEGVGSSRGRSDRRLDPRQSLAPIPVEELMEIRKIVAEPAPADLPWRLSQPSWTTTWGPEAFGPRVGKGPVDVGRFRFRVPPDSGEAGYAGTPYVVESYLDGFPARGLRRSGNFDTFSRPLGFRCRRDGLVDRAAVFVWAGGRWAAPKLTRRGKTALLGPLCLFESRYAYPAERPSVGFGEPWCRIVGEGGATYGVDRDLRCVGPFGNRCQIDPDVRSLIEAILKGDWNKEPATGP